MGYFYFCCIFILIIFPFLSCQERSPKSLQYYEFGPLPYPYSGYPYADPSIPNDAEYLIDENDFSRTVPNPRRKNRPYNSPIYYIRLPPQPYMFVPGLGYMSQPPQSPMSEFLNLPVDFVANGKPSTIYQWNANAQPPKPPTKPPKNPENQQSTMHKVPGPFNFNGKPENVFVLRDSYNALYGDALQNFYP